MLRVLVVDSSRERAADVCSAIALAGHQVAAVLSSALELSDQVLNTKPDVIFIQADSPSRDTLEHLAIMNRDCPRPVLLFSQDADSEMIRRAVKAGVSSYVVDSVSPARLDAVVEVAIAQFEAFQHMRAERDDADGAGEQAADLQADDGHHRDQRVAQQVRQRLPHPRLIAHANFLRFVT